MKVLENEIKKDLEELEDMVELIKRNNQKLATLIKGEILGLKLVLHKIERRKNESNIHREKI